MLLIVRSCIGRWGVCAFAVVSLALGDTTGALSASPLLQQSDVPDPCALLLPADAEAILGGPVTAGMAPPPSPFGGTPPAQCAYTLLDDRANSVLLTINQYPDLESARATLASNGQSPLNDLGDQAYLFEDTAALGSSAIAMVRESNLIYSVAIETDRHSDLVQAVTDLAHTVISRAPQVDGTSH